LARFPVVAFALFAPSKVANVRAVVLEAQATQNFVACKLKVLYGKQKPQQDNGARQLLYHVISSSSRASDKAPQEDDAAC
jgi:hypothetical protein